MSKIKIGVLSFAHSHARGYLRALKTLENVSILTADPGNPNGADFAIELGVEYVDSYDEFFAWNPEAVVVCSENTRHRTHVEMCAAAGAHVLCEKPLATTVNDCEAMIRACETSGVTLMVAYPMRCTPMFKQLRLDVEDGKLGQIISAVGTNNGRIPGGWFTRSDLSGGGAIIDHLVHCSDLLNILLAPARPQSVYAVSNTIIQDPNNPVDDETGAIVLITYSSGVTAMIDCSWSQPINAPTWGGLTLELIGVDRSVMIDPFALRIEGFSQKDKQPIWLPFISESTLSLLQEFLSCIADGRTPEADGPAGLSAVELVEAAVLSTKTGTPIQLRGEA